MITTTGRGYKFFYFKKTDHTELDTFILIFYKIMISIYNNNPLFY